MNKGKGSANSSVRLSAIKALTARERFMAILSNGPLLQSDAVVVLCGEDAVPRLEIAAQLMFSEGAKLVVLTGGKHDPPRWQGANELTPKLMGMGVAHSRILLDAISTNTREQAVNIVDRAIEGGWKRLMLVASPYHSYRAFLTFLRALQEREVDKAIQLVMVPASQVPWWSAPDGMEQTRIELLDTELAKMAQYGAHVASYEEGLEYLAYWESYTPEPQE